ncbi:DNA-binding protein [Halorubellus litoreus]|uniref:DNA-binding protein n=1 Tax=Halorubellus litoreus TaxID=755308 RepID=A0ABD5VJH7_9EURY
MERQPAVRLFAEELTDCTDEFTESDEERAPSFVTLPSGGKANRVFMVGTLTNVEDIGSDSEYWQARVVDPTGAVNVYAGEYQQEAMATLRQLEAPTYVAVTGKPRVYEPEDSDEAYVSLRPESIQVVDEDTRETWVVETAAATMERIGRSIHPDESEGERAREVYDDLDVGAYHESVERALESLEVEADADVGPAGTPASAD